MDTRTFSTTNLSQRASARRRLKRTTATRPLFCRTNGCATFMQPDGQGGATCPVCGGHRRLS